MMKNPRLATSVDIGVVEEIGQLSLLSNYFQTILVTVPFQELPENPSFTLFSRQLLKEGKELTKKNFHQKISNERNLYDYLCIEATSPSVVSHAVSSRKVDAIRISGSAKIKLFNYKVFQRCAQEGKFVEIDFNPVIREQNQKEIRNLIRVISHLKHTSVRVIPILHASNLQELRSHRDLRSVADYLGIPRNNTRAQPLLDKLRINRGKLTGHILADDIEVEE